MPVIGWDHASLPARDPEALVAFYKKLGFATIHEEEWRAGKHPIVAIQIGAGAKLNFHDPRLWENPSFEARGAAAQPGCGDLCFLFDGTIDEVVELLRDADAPILYGPFDRLGGADCGQREGTSVYTRDPDGNLVEFMTYPAAGRGRWNPKADGGAEPA